MSSIIGIGQRTWQLYHPPSVKKQKNALKFGILGAATIAHIALIAPSRSHPEVIVHAVAARDKAKAKAFARKHKIPNVKESYQALLDDPDIDAVYIALPNSLHMEWALRALAAGKHVLLEKPSTCTATDAKMLFNSPLHSRVRAPVLMETFHNRFSPAWELFKSLIHRPTLTHVTVAGYLPGFMTRKDGIHSRYDLGGGSILDFGTYHVAALRDVFGMDPEECLFCKVKRLPPPNDRVDARFFAGFLFPGDSMGEILGGFKASLSKEFSLPTVYAKHHSVHAEGETAADGEVISRVREVKLVNFIMPSIYHRIEIKDKFVVSNTTTGADIRTYEKKEVKKAYTFRDFGVDKAGEMNWSTYRYMLEQFVNRVRGRWGTGIWITHADSIAQMKALDMLYERSEVGERLRSYYRPEDSS